MSELGNQETVKKNVSVNTHVHRTGGLSSTSDTKLHHGGSFQKYMEGKIRKLDAQFRGATSTTVEEQTDPELRYLFKGISIHVNGYTDPSHAELKRLMRIYGGTFQNYYSRSSVTHIVCSNLPDAKVKQFEKERDPPPIVRPEWITESIIARKLLPIADYILHCIRPGGPGQRTLQWARVERNAVQTCDAYDTERLAQAQDIAKQMRQNCQILKGPPKSSKDDPNFIESFYQASRLHFIGTWKTRLEKLMLSGIAEHSPRPTANSAERVVIHVDMDCFFASVTEASHPEFKGLPLAVCHSNAKGSGEISSANYEARRYGIHASMFMGRAKELCPMLVVVPYEFEKYEAVSETLYRILLKYTSVVQAVSCDEAYLDITGLGDPMDIASRLRLDIEKATSCCASAGIGPNMLLARIATAKAKPNGQFYLKTENALQELAGLDINELPGIGWRTGEKLRDAGFNTLRDIHQRKKEDLQKIIGNKAGSLTYAYAFGLDDRHVIASSSGVERKSVGAEINWGIRFQSQNEAEDFLHSLSQQVYDRLQELKLRGKSITLKVKKKRKGAGEPRKFLGMGICDSLSRSSALTGKCSVDTIFKTTLPLLRSLRLHFADIRGLGLSVTKLEPFDSPCPVMLQKKHLDCFTKAREENGKPLKFESSDYLNPAAIDPDVLSELPAEIQEEIQRQYNLKPGVPKQQQQTDTLPSIHESKKRNRSTDSGATKRRDVPFIEYDPLRMSQIDASVLHELPPSLQQEIIKSMEPFRKNKDHKIKKSNPVVPLMNKKQMLANQAKEMHAMFNSLKMTLAGELQGIATLLHEGKVIGFLAALELWLSKGATEPTTQTYVAQLCEIIICECKSSVSSLSLHDQWTLSRGIERIFTKYPVPNFQHQDILHHLENIIKNHCNLDH